MKQPTLQQVQHALRYGRAELVCTRPMAHDIRIPIIGVTEQNGELVYTPAPDATNTAGHEPFRLVDQFARVLVVSCGGWEIVGQDGDYATEEEAYAAVEMLRQLDEYADAEIIVRERS